MGKKLLKIIVWNESRFHRIRVTRKTRETPCTRALRRNGLANGNDDSIKHAVGRRLLAKREAVQKVEPETRKTFFSRFRRNIIIIIIIMLSVRILRVFFLADTHPRTNLVPEYH